MLAYYIMGSANPEHAARLLNSIYFPANQYYITFDNHGALERFKRTSTAFENMIVKCIPSVTWGGISMVASILQGMVNLLKENSHWEYFILLSDSHVALKPQRDICSILEQQAEKGHK